MNERQEYQSINNASWLRVDVYDDYVSIYATHGPHTYNLTREDALRLAHQIIEELK